MRQIRKLANLSFDARLALIAEGLPVILRSAQDLVAVKLPRFGGVELDLGDYGSVVTASIAAS